MEAHVAFRFVFHKDNKIASYFTDNKKNASAEVGGYRADLLLYFFRLM